MEVASLAVGVVPLVVGALKAYRAVHQYVRVFRHYALEIKRLFNRLQVQQCILENELDFIFRKAAIHQQGVPSLSATELLAQSNSPSLLVKASTIDDAIRSLLSRHANTFKNLLIGITEQLQELQNELKCFEVVKAEQTKGESMKQTILRVKARIKIGFDKRRLRELLDDLRNDNEDLRCISSSLEYEPKSSPFSLFRKPVTTMPADILRNRAANLALHESLRSCWTCIDPDHAEHVAKLCLETLKENARPPSKEVRLDLAVACLPKVPPTSQQAVVSSPIWLYVRTLTEMPAASNKKAKRPRVEPIMSATNGRPLINNGSVCELLSKCRCKGKSDEACLNYSQPDSGLRHLFYHCCTPSSPARSSARSVALSDVLSEIRTELTMDQQFALSRRLVLSVLELYKSSWLPQRWRINDISTFAKPSSDDSLFVQQLHVTSAISKSTTRGAIASGPHWAVTCPNRPSDNILFSDINNSTLFSLGVAFLEIAHGKSLEEFQQSSDPNLLCTVQRLAQRTCPLGERYKKLAQQCLRCDFGCGAEFELCGLQDAVYTDVVGQLEDLMAVLGV